MYVCIYIYIYTFTHLLRLCLLVFVFVVFASCVHPCSHVSEDKSSVLWKIWRMQMMMNDSIALMVMAARLQMTDEDDDPSAMTATSGS